MNKQTELGDEISIKRFLAFGVGQFSDAIALQMITIYLFTFYRGIELTGASIATIFFLLSAVFTAIFAYIFLEETINIISGIGAILILLGALYLAK